MGQYYLVVFLDAAGTIVGMLNAWDYGCGAKLMEHAYVGTSVVVNAVSLLVHGGRFEQGVRVVWAGDYADSEPNDAGNLYSLASEHPVPTPVVAGVDVAGFPYMVNISKHMFVRVPDRGVHPLPILTAEGNGRGGGDMAESHPWYAFVGIWARDVVCFRDTPPDDFAELALP